MKKLIFGLLIAIMLAGGAVAAMSAPAYAQAYQYPPQPADPYASPWVGSDTPWVYYNGDWFLNGILYFFFGPQYGWCPYYAYPYAYIVRPHTWYGPMWLTWYRGQPQYWQRFERSYPYWRSHREGRHYDQNFYQQHHRSQGAGWQKGFQGRPAAPAHPEGQRPTGPTQVTPPERKKPAPSQVTPTPGPKPGPTRVAPPERQKQAPSRVTPPEAPKPAPSRVAPPAAPQPGPSKAGPPAAPKSGPAAPAPAAPKQGKSAPAAPQPEKGGKGEGKH